MNNVNLDNAGTYYNIQMPVRCYSCINNPTSNTTDRYIKYNTLKKIQRTVGVSTSQYLHDRAALTAAPATRFTWNNLSDRDLPHVQKPYNSTILSTYTPGSMSPGGIGCDIKHGSYVRYINRLKGKKFLRAGTIPETFDLNTIPFNRAYPIYGNKQIKTAIVSCPSCPTQQSLLNVPTELYYQPYVFSIGQPVAVLNPTTNKIVKGTISEYYSESNSYAVYINPITIHVPAISLYLVKC